MIRAIIFITPLILGAGFAFAGAWIPVKAALAQHLLSHAWERTLSGEPFAKPWPWADMAPAFKLDFAGKEMIVLGNDSGEALAFGPGWLPQSARPGTPGLALIAAHRDTHYNAIGALHAGDTITVPAPSGADMTYSVQTSRVVTANASGLTADWPGEWLGLVTCWPLGSDRQTDERYVVLAERIPLESIP
ncbi:MAG: sortase domain-bontaining protein [Sphingomonadales bacterium]